MEIAKVSTVVGGITIFLLALAVVTSIAALVSRIGAGETAMDCEGHAIIVLSTEYCARVPQCQVTPRDTERYIQSRMALQAECKGAIADGP